MHLRDCVLIVSRNYIRNLRSDNNNNVKYANQFKLIFDLIKLCVSETTTMTSMNLIYLLFIRSFVFFFFLILRNVIFAHFLHLLSKLHPNTYLNTELFIGRYTIGALSVFQIKSFRII